MHGFRDGDENGIAGRVRLMARDVEMADAESEIDRVDIFERRGQVRQMREDEERGQRSRRVARVQAGRSRSPSFRLPVRYPWRSRLTYR